jgi:predicted DNA-binding transcriptional regulator YafY
MTRSRVRSPTYDLFDQAINDRKQVFCTYDGYPREICPIILGHTNGQEVALAYQFAGESKSGLPPEGQWKCFRLSKVNDVQLRDGPWHDGDGHTKHQNCVKVVDLDVNPDSPYQPKRRVWPPRRRPARRRGKKPRR